MRITSLPQSAGSACESAAPVQPCRPRNVYIDVGVNWCVECRHPWECSAPALNRCRPPRRCNTLQLFQDLPQALAHPDTPWEVFGFEAAPLITPHAERCCQALSRGEPMPEAPVPPTGSSAELAKQRDAHGCKPPRRNRTFDWDAQHYWWLECALAKLRPALSRLKPDPALNEEQRTRRMRAARASCPPSDHRDRYTLLPSAVGSKGGTMRVYGGPEALVRGGVLPTPKLQVRRRQHECAHPWFQPAH